MAESELLLQPEMLVELKRYRALERRHQVSQQQSQELQELARQVEPANSISLSTPLRDGSPAAELDATLSALKKQTEIIYQIEAQRNEQVGIVRKPSRSAQPSPMSDPEFPIIQQNIKIALYFIGGIIVLALLLALLHSAIH